MSTPGERGQQGDHGQDGDQGIMGLPGERGYQGTVGQTGQTGERGVPGDEGPAGRTGATGPPLFSWRQVLALLMAIVACFSLLAYRAEQNTTDISRNTQNLKELVYAQCVVQRTDVLKTNAFYEGLIRIEKNSPVTQDLRAAAERIALYEDSKLAIPYCGPKP